MLFRSGPAGNRRYYLDATLTPVLMPGTDGKLTEIMHQVMVYHKEDETEIVIRILSFGPMIKVTAPVHFIDLIKQRLIEQKKL